MAEAKKRVPKRRFKEFQNTEAWEQRKLGEIADQTYGGGTPRTSVDEFWNGNIPWIQSSDLTDGKLFGVIPNKMISASGLKNSATKLVPENSIAIITRVGVGKLAFMPFAYATSQDYLSLSKLNIDPWFGVYSCYKKLQSELHAVQGTSIKGITKDELLEKEISVPCIDEQQQIGSLFRNLDKLITLHQRKLEKIQSMKKAYLSEMFPAEGESRPKRRFKGFTEDWEKRKLEDIVDLCSGRDYKHLSRGNIPVYGTGGYMLSVSDALSYNKDAIGIGRKGTIDKPYILKSPFWTVDTLFYAIPRAKHNLDFLYGIFQNIDWKQKDESSGVPSLSKVAIINTNILVPEINEQKKIGKFLIDIDMLLTLHQEKLDKLKKLKKSYLNEMFI
jgi:type I restriction enzyme S subunit